MISDNGKSAKTKIASILGIGFVALILVFMIFGTGSSGKVGKWEYSKATANGSGNWYIRFTQNNAALFKLDVKGEIPSYLIGLDFFVNDLQKDTGWTKVSDSSEMGINNFNSNPEKMNFLSNHWKIQRKLGRYIQRNGFMRAKKERLP